MYEINISGDVVTTDPMVIVLGNGVEISDGDSSPSNADGTDFGSVLQGGSPVSHTFTVRNDGAASLSLLNLNVPPGFTITNLLNSQLDLGQSDTFVVQMETGSTGPKSGQISFTTNDPNAPEFNFSITGNIAVAAPQIVVTTEAGANVPQPSPTYSLGAVVQDQLGPTITFRVANSGGSNLFVHRPDMPNGFSLVDGIDSPIVPGDSDTFTAQLDSTFLGFKSGSIRIGYGDNKTFLINVTGTVTAPTEDSYEENDNRGDAYHPGFTWDRTWLSNLNGKGILKNDDWYRIDVHSGSLLIRADLDFLHAEGNIDLELYNSAGTKLAESRTM